MTANTTQQAQVPAPTGSGANAAIVVRDSGKPQCAACGDATRYDPQTGAHEKTWCAVCNPAPVIDQVPF